ncbi:MAG TPA: hypothetical protein VIY86_11000, partial [Pirellulaceae bacterium]
QHQRLDHRAVHSPRPASPPASAPPRFLNLSGMWNRLPTVARVTPRASDYQLLAHQSGEPDRPQPDLHDQQLEDAGLLGRDQLVPRGILGV